MGGGDVPDSISGGEQQRGGGGGVEQQHYFPEVIMTDCSSTYTSAIATIFPTSKHLWCWFHVKRAMLEWIRSKFPGQHNEDRRDQLLHFAKSLFEVNLDSQGAYEQYASEYFGTDEASKALWTSPASPTTQSSPQTYFINQWFKNVEYWAPQCRIHCFGFAKETNTNNHLERHNGTLKWGRYGCRGNEDISVLVHVFRLVIRDSQTCYRDQQKQMLRYPLKTMRITDISLLLGLPLGTTRRTKSGASHPEYEIRLKFKVKSSDDCQQATLEQHFWYMHSDLYFIVLLPSATFHGEADFSRIVSNCLCTWPTVRCGSNAVVNLVTAEVQFEDHLTNENLRMDEDHVAYSTLSVRDNCKGHTQVKWQSYVGEPQRGNTRPNPALAGYALSCMLVMQAGGTLTCSKPPRTRSVIEDKASAYTVHNSVTDRDYTVNIVSNPGCPPAGSRSTCSCPHF